MWFVPGGAAVGQPQLGDQVPRAQLADPVADPEPVQHSQPVRRERDTGPDLGELPRLLVYPHVDPGLRERERRRDPADPAADDNRS